MGREESWALLQVLETWGKKRQKSVSQMALGWLLSRKSITSPIIGPRSMPQLEDNLGAVGLRLDADEMEALEGSGTNEGIG
jgi:aryl-alcohol dehydrogenase-like predicted oxidoreductase